MPIQAAGKYAEVRRARMPGGPSVRTRDGSRTGRGSFPLTPALSPGEREKRSAVPHAGRAPGGVGTSGLNILIPQHEMLVRWDEFMWKELREGGMLQQYIAREKGTTGKRYRNVARRMAGVRQDAKSEFKLKAAIPARDFFRWREKDPHFFEDDKNLKSLRRDNPDVCVYD